MACSDSERAVASPLVTFMVSDRKRISNLLGNTDDETLCRHGYARLQVHEFLLAVDDDPEKFELLMRLCRQKEMLQEMKLCCGSKSSASLETCVTSGSTQASGFGSSQREEHAALQRGQNLIVSL
ncbi:unnamed protein product [Cladocopium goreaui]|uniref:Uncharacterized protein n=1 Tax=Cladocopium goreaui TaxID=2562237 RepID=A0A9P1BNP5_9DINO|nr:unnamed protein product [Cladocopium goreaui]